MYSYNSLSNYLKEEYGEKLCKLSFSSGCTCPNRDGTRGFGGCVFCSLGGSGEFAVDLSKAVTAEQIELAFEAAKSRVSGKSHSERYIAYFQSFTNTYGDVSRLMRLYRAVIEREDVAVLSIATRPDCLDAEVMEMLSALCKIKPVWVELGLQCVKEETVAYIRRGYDNAVYRDAVQKLEALGIKTITHVILGLPNEDLSDMEKTISFACQSGTWGLKLQLLHVLSGTDLATDYEAGRFEVLELSQYVDIICRLLPKIPKDRVIHRLTGDGDKKLLIAPIWSGNKRNVLNTLMRELDRRGIVQGSDCTF